MKAVQAGVPRSMAYNAINQSELLSQADLEAFCLEEEGPLHWKLLGAGRVHTTAVLALYVPSHSLLTTVWHLQHQKRVVQYITLL